jgi:hypothetical protein
MTRLKLVPKVLCAPMLTRSDLLQVSNRLRPPRLKRSKAVGTRFETADGRVSIDCVSEVQ